MLNYLRPTIIVLLALAAVSLSGAISAQTLVGLVSWWPGDGNADDIVDGNPGTLHGGATFAPGKVGQAFSLDGVDDFVQVAHNPNLDPGIGPFSIAAWVKTMPSTGTIVSKYECGQSCPSRVANSLYTMFVTNGGRLQVRLRDSDARGGIQILTGATFIADGNFHHVVMLRDMAASELRIYLDGALDASAALVATGAIKDDDGEADPFLIGAAFIGGQTTKHNFFSGLIDEVQFYNRALSESEIQALSDTDGDGVPDVADNCPNDPNPDQTDTDDDGFGDGCDDDDDNDGTPDGDDACPFDRNEDTDSDGDGICDNADNCPSVSNADQADTDGDGMGDACDDSDGDGVVDADDQCPGTPQGESVNENGCSTAQLGVILTPKPTPTPTPAALSAVQLPTAGGLPPSDGGNSLTPLLYILLAGAAPAVAAALAVTRWRLSAISTRVIGTRDGQDGGWTWGSGT